ncbi:hypothetical protein FQR65_LT20557 [Abscondita terminalis]|nr:hypothetical protein FQR65_LT20557 [Abscondita terminalis]
MPSSGTPGAAHARCSERTAGQHCEAGPAPAAGLTIDDRDFNPAVAGTSTVAAIHATLPRTRTRMGLLQPIIPCTWSALADHNWVSIGQPFPVDLPVLKSPAGCSPCNSWPKLTAMATRTANCDKIDRKILAILQAEGRIFSFTELGERVAPVDQRHALSACVDEREGDHTATTHLDPAAVKGQSAGLCGNQPGLQIGRHLRGIPPRGAEAVNQLPQNVPMECHLVSGDFDYLLKARIQRNGLLPQAARAARSDAGRITCAAGGQAVAEVPRLRCHGGGTCGVASGLGRRRYWAWRNQGQAGHQQQGKLAFQSPLGVDRIHLAPAPCAAHERPSHWQARAGTPTFSAHPQAHRPHGSAAMTAFDLTPPTATQTEALAPASAAKNAAYCCSTAPSAVLRRIPRQTSAEGVYCCRLCATAAVPLSHQVRFRTAGQLFFAPLDPAQHVPRDSAIQATAWCAPDHLRALRQPSGPRCPGRVRRHLQPPLP